MSRNEKDGAAATRDPRQSQSENLKNDGFLAAMKREMRRRESAVAGDKAAVQGREQLATAREDAVDLRENAADAREGAATSRESEIRAAETTQATADDQMMMLQHANAHLVIATIEAHKMAEEVQTAKAKLDHLAHHDALTDLPNRILLKDRLSQAIELARRQGRQLAVMYMDLDQFKHINDSLGHAVGDQLLQSVAQRLVGSVRQSDTICRLGGDEFVLLLPYIERAEDAAFSAQKIFAALTQPHHIDQTELHITVSIGISIYPDDGEDADTLLKSADIAMYFAKEVGRNNYKFFEQNMNVRAVQRQATEAGLRRALARQEFVLHYQPKINLYSGAIVGIEALIRWQHPERGLLPPAEFVSIAEDCGLILPIGRWVLREACRQAQAWRQAGLSSATIAVNTSALEFRASDFLENVHTTLAETQLPPRYLELELTESVLMRDAESTATVLRALTELGVKLAVDDFGTGYSSLSYLRKFPIDTLKIDQSFVGQMSASPDDATIVRAVISMGQSLKQRVIAEGVETPEQYNYLLAQHCDEGQGFYFGRPLPAEEFVEVLEKGMPESLRHSV